MSNATPDHRTIAASWRYAITIDGTTEVAAAIPPADRLGQPLYNWPWVLGSVTIAGRTFSCRYLGAQRTAELASTAELVEADEPCSYIAHHEYNRAQTAQGS